MYFFRSLKTPCKEYGSLFLMKNLALNLKKNPCLEYVLYKKNSDEVILGSFYPCVKYKIPGDLGLDGTDSFIVAESMFFKTHSETKRLKCFLSFTCENDQKAFYKITKDCLRFRIKKEYF